MIIKALDVQDVFADATPAEWASMKPEAQKKVARYMVTGRNPGCKYGMEHLEVRSVKTGGRHNWCVPAEYEVVIP